MVVVVMALFSGCAGTPVPEEVGLRPDGSIPVAAPPPSSPNCVSSYVSPADDSTHGIEPFSRGSQSAAEAQRTIRALLEAEERTEILADIPGYLHAVQYTAFWKFPDDIEFWFPEDEALIQFRSAARLGKSDLGVNRKRMERIRVAYDIQAQK